MFSKKISLFIMPLVAMSILQAEDPNITEPLGDEIFKEMYQMQKEMDKIFERIQKRMEERSKQWNYPHRDSLITGSQMAVESTLVDKGTYYEYNTQVPESQDNQIDISIEDNVLHFKAKVDTATKTYQPDMKMQQRYVSMVQRTETLPQDVDPTSLKSEYQNGILVLTLQKKKSIEHPVLKEKEKQPAESVQETIEKETPANDDKNETNRTKIRVPHTSSHV